MATRADVEHMASTIATVSDQAKQQVGALMSRLAGQPATVVRNALLDAFPPLLAGFENVGVAVGLEFYDSMRARTHDLPAYTATAVANPTPVADAVGIARAAARHLFNPDLAPEVAGERTRRELSDALGTRTKNAMRQTIKNNAVRDPANVTYARVPRGAKTCAFCTMLASRGFVYATAKTAGAEDKYHHDCDCMIVPSWKGLKVNVKGYSDADHYANYHAARSSLEAEGVKYPKANEITARMREMFPGEYTDGHTGKPKGRPKGVGALGRTDGHGAGRSKSIGPQHVARKKKPLPVFSSLDENVPASRKRIVKNLERLSVSYRQVKPLSEVLDERDIISRLSGGDETGGSCTSQAFAFAANRAGLDVLDYRGGKSRKAFANARIIRDIFSSDEVEAYFEHDVNDLDAVHRLLDKTQSGKYYMLSTGQHAAVIRNTGEVFEYLELQSRFPSHNGWHPLDDSSLVERFYCKELNLYKDRTVHVPSEIAELDSLASSSGYNELMGFLNTAPHEQRKGNRGDIK